MLSDTGRKHPSIHKHSNLHITGQATSKHCLHQVKEDCEIIFKDKLGPVELECGNISSLAACGPQNFLKNPPVLIHTARLHDEANVCQQAQHSTKAKQLYIVESWRNHEHHTVMRAETS